MNIEELHSIYFVGIGGIGMSALARYFNAMGTAVFGYDRVRTPLTQKMEDEGMAIIYQDGQEHINPDFLAAPPDQTLVIYTPAVPTSHIGLAYLRSRGYHPIKRSELLERVISDLKTIAIAGTHGKTTTTAMVAHILRTADIPCNAFLGGIATNYNSNILLHPKAQYAVVEADEYDRSFLKLHPYIAVVTSIDADHLDIYDNTATMTQAFQEFTDKVLIGGTLISKAGTALVSKKKTTSYGLDKDADLHAAAIEVAEGAYHFDLIQDGKRMGRLELLYPGRHNVENAIAAVAVALQLGISWEKIAEAIKTFKGVKRRFEYHINRKDRVFIDDYAHHPTEITACVGSVKELYPDRRITGVFQPHLYSRTRDFMDDFAHSLEALNELILMEIYPAREEPIPGVESTALLDKIRMVNKKICQRENIVDEVVSLSPEVLLTMGAGDIDKLIEPLRKALDEEID